MDPLSHGLLGASLSQSSTTHKKFIVSAGIVGFLSAMAPDLDILIRSEQDPLLFFEFHRQFTHSLFFIPFGALLCAGLFYFLFKSKTVLTFKEIWLYATLGYATHGLLDSCTSYGTLLFWPFSYERIAWNNVSIIDPLFTLPILLLLLLSMLLKRISLARMGLLWALLYLGFGVIQHHRAEELAMQLALERGHVIEKIQTKPTFGNLFLWKAVYASGGYFYTDGIRLYPSTKIYEGGRIKKLDVIKDFPWLNKDSQQAKDIARFSWFSAGFIALSPNNPNQIIDIRYSMLPNEIEGLWGIELDQEAENADHIKYITNRSVSKKRFQDLWGLLLAP